MENKPSQIPEKIFMVYYGPGQEQPYPLLLANKSALERMRDIITSLLEEDCYGLMRSMTTSEDSLRIGYSPTEDLKDLVSGKASIGKVGTRAKA